MQLTNLRLSCTKNLGNYESAKVEAEAIPDNSQDLASFERELQEYVADQLDAAADAILGRKGSKGAPLAEGKAGSKAKAAKPAAGKSKGVGKTKADPTQASQTDASAKSPPATKLAAKTAKKPKKSTAKKKDDKLHEKQLQYAVDSESLEELLERFNDLQAPTNNYRDSFTVDEWEAGVAQVADRYRKLNTVTSDPGTLNQLIAAFKAERNFVDEQRAA